MEKLDFIDSKFRLAILAAKRAKQLVGGNKKRIDTDAENPLTIALEEIYEGKIDFQIFDDDENNIDKSERFHLSLDGNSDDDDSSFRIDEESAEEFLFGKDDEDNQEEAS